MCNEERSPQAMIDLVALSSFLILLGVLEAIPGSQGRFLLLGTGVILLGKNLLRHVTGSRMRPLGLILGGGVLAAGLAGFLSPDPPFFAIFLLAAGVAGLGTAALPGAPPRVRCCGETMGSLPPRKDPA